VAVVENLGGTGATFSLSGFNVRVSPRADLRRDSDEPAGELVTLPFAFQTIGRGDRVVIPLHLELRANRVLGGIQPWDISPSNANADRISRAFVGLRDDQILKASLDRVEMKKLKRAFLPIQQPSVTRTYVYGRRYTLESMTVENRIIPIRRLDPSAVAMVAGIEGGSCPILYVKRRDSSEVLRMGTILRTAHGRHANQTQEIKLAEDVTGFTIAEEEPERTVLTQIVLVEIASSGVEKEVLRRLSPVAIESGEELAVDFPPAPVGSRYVLRVTGYYQTYGELLSAVPSLNR
jgi:hypothetical protein